MKEVFGHVLSSPLVLVKISTKFGTHVSQEGLPDVVTEASKGNLLEGNEPLVALGKKS